MKRAARILVTANLRYRMMDFRYPGIPWFWWKSLVLVWFINEFLDQNFGNFMIQNHSRDPIGIENRELGTQTGFKHLLRDFLAQYEARSSNSRHSQSSVSDDGFSKSWYPAILDQWNPENLIRTKSRYWSFTEAEVDKIPKIWPRKSKIGCDENLVCTPYILPGSPLGSV